MSPNLDDLVNGKYRVVRRLGEGGMGCVFEAKHERLDARVALKFLHHDLEGREELMHRFVQEARLLASVKSPHVVQVNDVETTPEGQPFMVLEYLEGRTLQRVHHDMHVEGRRLTQAESLSLACQILEGAGAAHDVGIVHRDMKPDNVMIIEGQHGEPFVKLLDFGIAKPRAVPDADGATAGVTRPGSAMGTPEYMAPEQAFSADAVDARADVFAIGVMTFEMLGGCRPVAGDDPQILAAVHLSGDVPRLESLVHELPEGLGDVVHKAMAPRPADRYGTARDFLAALLPIAEKALEQHMVDLPAASAQRPSSAVVMRAPLVDALVGEKLETTIDTSPPSFVSASEPAAITRDAVVAPTPSAREPMPTTRPAQAVVIDSGRFTPANPAFVAADGASATAFAPVQPIEVIASPPDASRSARASARSRLVLWLVLAFGVVAAVGAGLYIANPNILGDDEPRPRPRPPTHKRAPKRPAPAPSR